MIFQKRRLKDLVDTRKRLENLWCELETGPSDDFEVEFTSKSMDKMQLTDTTQSRAEQLCADVCCTGLFVLVAPRNIFEPSLYGLCFSACRMTIVVRVMTFPKLSCAWVYAGETSMRMSTTSSYNFSALRFKNFYCVCYRVCFAIFDF